MGCAIEAESARRRFRLVLFNFNRVRPLPTGTRVRLHFTPTYSSWLNQVQIWFARIEPPDCTAASAGRCPPAAARSHINRQVENRLCGAVLDSPSTLPSLISPVFATQTANTWAWGAGSRLPDSVTPVGYRGVSLRVLGLRPLGRWAGVNTRRLSPPRRTSPRPHPRP